MRESTSSPASQLDTETVSWTRASPALHQSRSCNVHLLINITHLFNGPFSRTTRVGQYQKSKTNLDFTEARDSEWQWHQLGAICKSAPRSRQITMPTPHHSFFTGRMPFRHPTNSVKALKAHLLINISKYNSKISYWTSVLHCKQFRFDGNII